MTYQYQSLHHDDAIRLLKLHPAAKAEDQIRCDLEEHMLCDISAYEAVSYVWGTSAGHTSVLCVDKDFRVTHNLAAALRRFRTSDENRYLWVDAICINQNDISERNEQVKMMQKIYQNASRVLVWLGAADMAVHAAVQLIDQMFIVACRYWGFDSNETVHFDDVDDFVDFPSTPAIPPSGSDEWQPLIDFFSREWFQRTWIVQEVTAARVVTAFCGNYELSWQRIGVAASWVQKQITKGDFNHFSEFENSNVYKAMVLYDKPYLQQQDFLDLLAQLRDFAATDKKDKVYALLGLEPFSTLPRSIQIDYNKSKVEVYKDVVEVSLKYHKDLSILSFIHHSSAIDETWPTFVPPWDTAPTAANLLGQSPGFESYASGEVKLDAFGYKLTDTSLTLYGLSLGSINIVGELMSADHFRGMSDHFEHDKHPVQRFWKHHLNAFQDYRKVPSVDLLVIRLCLTMTAAQNSNYEKVDRAFDDGRNHIDGHLADYAAYIQNFDSESAALRLIVQDLNEEDDYTGDPTKFEIAASRVCDDRRLFLFGDEFIGLGPNVLQAEDQLCILFGGQHLYILRPRGGCHQLVGECFVQGLMWGEGSEAYRDDGTARNRPCSKKYGKRSKDHDVLSSNSGIEPARKRIRFNTGVDAFLAEHSLRPRVLDYEKAGFAALLNSGDYKHLDLRDLIATLVYIVDGPQGAEHLIDGQMKTYKCTVLAADHEGATEATSWKQFRIEKGDYRVVILIDLHERCSNVPMSDVDRGLAAQDADIKLVYGEAENWFEELGRCFWRLQESPECSFGPDGTFWGSEWADAPDYNKHESWIMDLTAKLVLDKIIKRAK